MRIRAFVPAVLLALTAVPAAPQAWDSPSFFSPRPGEDIGLYLVSPERGDLGFAGIWRQSGNINLGVRAGLAGSDHIQVGAEFFGPLHLLGPQSPVLLSWVLGLGASFNDVTALRVPLGISAGVTLGTGGITIMPYVHPRLAFDLFAYDTGGGEEETETEFNFPVDIGADVALGEAFVLKVGATLGDRGTVIGAGIAYRMSRRLIVR
jgi:hypothetical protein